MALFDELGIDEKIVEAASASTVSEGFVALPSGQYPGEIESIVVFKNRFEGTEMRILVKIPAENKTLTYRKDISKNDKEGNINQGFVSRLKSLEAATGFSADDLTFGKETVTVNSFGKPAEGKALLGMNGKKVIALVRLSEDTFKDEKDNFRIGNDIEGVCAAKSEDITKFEEKVAKLEGSAFTWASQKKKAATVNQEQQKQDVNEALETF